VITLLTLVSLAKVGCSHVCSEALLSRVALITVCALVLFVRLTEVFVQIIFLSPLSITLRTSEHLACEVYIRKHFITSKLSSVKELELIDNSDEKTFLFSKLLTDLIFIIRCRIVA